MLNNQRVNLHKSISNSNPARNPWNEAENAAHLQWWTMGFSGCFIWTRVKCHNVTFKYSQMFNVFQCSSKSSKNMVHFFHHFFIKNGPFFHHFHRGSTFRGAPGMTARATALSTSRDSRALGGGFFQREKKGEKKSRETYGGWVCYGVNHGKAMKKCWI